MGLAHGEPGDCKLRVVAMLVFDASGRKYSNAEFWFLSSIVRATAMTP